MVATPIGNLDDITARAKSVLRAVDLIAAEDTRHSRKLLAQFGIGTEMVAYHDHNEREQTERLLERLQSGVDVALISDAGTPLISDPGYRLVSAAHAAGIRVVPVPGANAAITALSAAGMPSDRFIFEGFLPARSGQRQQRLRTLAVETRTLLFYESCHRIVVCLQDMVAILGPDRPATVARELTKYFETIRSGTLAELAQWVSSEAEQQKGELVLVVAGAADSAAQAEPDDTALRILLEYLPTKTAAEVAARLAGGKKNAWYQKALKIK